MRERPWRLPFALLVSLVLVPSSWAGGGEELADGAFRPLSFEAALAAGKAEGKPLLVSVGADWCSACKELERKSLSRGAVRELLRTRFVALRVDGEKGEGPALVKRYHVVGFPTVLVLGAEGREIDRVFEALDEGPFVEVLQGYLRGAGTLDDLLAKLRPGDLAAAFEVGSRYAIRGERERAILMLGDVILADVKNEKGFTTRSLLTLGKYLLLRGQNDAAAARQMLEWLVGYFPDAKETQEAIPSLAIAYARLGDEPQALRIFQGQIERAPAVGDGYNSLAWYYFREKKDSSKALATATVGLTRAPRDHGLWDSAAEFAHALGRRQDAVDLSRRAAGLDPAEPYYRYQLARFAKLAGVPVPSSAAPAPSR